MSESRGFIKDFYKDLRQRHLLPVVALLAVAIVAVPFLLKSTPEAVPPPPPVADTGEASEAVPAVMVDTEGIRDYRERLDVLRSKNPFTDHFAPPPSSVAEAGDTELAPEGSTVTLNSSAGAPTSDPGVTITPDSGSDTSTSSGTGSSESGSSSDVSIPPDTGGTEPADVITKEYRLSYRVDVLVGPTGEAEEQADVKMLSFLPSRKRPVAVFVGVTESDERAVFMLSTDVTGSTGEGECSPSAVNCQFITLKDDHRRTLTYAPEGSAPQDFTLELTGIELVVVEEGEDAIPKHAKRDPSSASVPSGMAAWLGLGA